MRVGYVASRVPVVGWKIVRDNQPEWSRKYGVSGVWRPAADPVASLTKKLFEEASEWGEAREVAELYDLDDVVSELIRRCDPDGTARREHAVKVARLGGFTQGTEWNPVPDET
jgi:predicted house-cleaning noncanonical NTP pyrophosphatase (MazG superfamily)